MKTIVVQLIEYSKLSDPITVEINSSLNSNLEVKKDDLVLIGFPEFDGLVGIGLVKKTQSRSSKLTENSPFVMARVSWPSRSVRKILASFKLNHLRIEESIDDGSN